MTELPMQLLGQAMRHHGLVRFVEHFSERFPDCHLKDLVVDEVDAQRGMVIDGHRVVNFGSDSFLGLDQDPRVQEAIIGGVKRWGTHNGASRAFSCVRSNTDAEDKIADWLGTEAALIYPSVSLANMGAIPGLVARHDLLVVDEHAHNSMQEGAKIAKANGTPLESFSHCDPVDLSRVFKEAGDYRVAVVAIDGVYSMTGALPPLAELNEVCLEQQGGALRRRRPWHGRPGRAGPRHGARRPGQLRQHSGRRFAVQGLFVHRRLHRLPGAVQAAAQDAVQYLHLRRPGGAALPGSRVRRLRHI